MAFTLTRRLACSNASPSSSAGAGSRSWLFDSFARCARRSPRPVPQEKQIELGSPGFSRGELSRPNQHLDHLYRLRPPAGVIGIEHSHPFFGGASAHAGSVSHIDREGSRIRVYHGLPDVGGEVIQGRNRAGNAFQPILASTHPKG